MTKEFIFKQQKKCRKHYKKAWIIEQALYRIAEKEADTKHKKHKGRGITQNGKSYEIVAIEPDTRNLGMWADSSEECFYFEVHLMRTTKRGQRQQNEKANMVRTAGSVKGIWEVSWQWRQANLSTIVLVDQFNFKGRIWDFPE